MKRLGMFAMMACLAVGPQMGQTVRDEVTLFFRNDVDKIEPDYSVNLRQLNALDSIFRAIDADSCLTLQRVNLAGWASPPASVTYNINLSHRRADAIKAWIYDHCPVTIDSIGISYEGVNYKLLSSMVKEHDYRYADEVTAIADDVPPAGRPDKREQRLRRARDGRIWEDLSRDYFPEMRRTDVEIFYDHCVPVVAMEPEAKETPAVADTVATPIPVAEPLPEVSPEVIPIVEQSPRYWSIHTNMLYDIIAIPNAGAEAYLGKNFSIAGNWWYAWWKTDRRHRYWRTYGGYIAPRYWFGKAAHAKPLTGHHIGVYAQVMLYDFEWGKTGYLSGTPYKNIFDHPTWGGGIEYGFALPLRRRLNIDFTLGVGYLQGRYWKYIPQDDHYIWLSKHNRKWLGLTKAEISLVWLLGNGNVNSRKGGGR